MVCGGTSRTYCITLRGKALPQRRRHPEGESPATHWWMTPAPALQLLDSVPPGSGNAHLHSPAGPPAERLSTNAQSGRTWQPSLAFLPNVPQYCRPLTDFTPCLSTPLRIIQPGTQRQRPITLSSSQRASARPLHRPRYRNHLPEVHRVRRSSSRRRSYTPFPATPSSPLRSEKYDW